MPERQAGELERRLRSYWKPLHYGWRTALPLGEHVVGAGFLRDGRFHFASVDPNIEHTPPPNGENWLHELFYENGTAQGDRPIFDLNGDRRLNDGDRISDGDGPVEGATGIPVAIYMGAGLISQPVLANINAQLSTTLFNDNPYLAPGDTGSVQSNDPGVSGGHFDVDIYYPTKSNTHVHEYDDKYDVTGVNFLNASDPAFNLSNAITNNGTKFKILISNQRLSPAVRFSYGGATYKDVVTLQTSATFTLSSEPEYTRANIGTLKFNMPKDAFKAKDWSGTGDTRVGLHPTQTGCVRSGWPTAWGDPGPNGEYRNGALVFQLVKHNTPDSAVEMARAGDPRYGYRLKLDATSQGHRLAEWSTFWHHPNKLCMHNVGWTPTPPMDTSASSKGSLPAAGSEDPPRDELGSVVSDDTSTTVNPACSGCTIKTTVTTYQNGGKLIVTQYIKADGKVTNTTWQYVPPPAGPGSGAGGGGGAGGTTPNIKTTFHQLRQQGKFGRVTWHEVFRQ